MEGELTEFDIKLYEYIRTKDFEKNFFSAKEVAEKFGVDERKIYESLSKISKKMKDKFLVYYRDGRIRIATE
ncbi:MAG: hypothetical protein AB1779_10535 [Candidatus Thermoplasmatota archaeon]